MNRKAALVRLKGLFVLILLSLLTMCIMQLFNQNLIPTKPSVPLPIDAQTFHKYDINCSSIYAMDPVEIEKSKVIRKSQIVEDTDESLFTLTLSCPLFIKARGYDKICLSEEEDEFPIAYSLVVHKHAWMVERLIRAIYYPGNIYCIHYDAKSSASFISAVKGLASCLPNVFIASKLEVIYYASITRLKADINCISDLLMSEVKWKYVINLCGQDFPLITNLELMYELKKLNGSNMLETVRPGPKFKSRYLFHHELNKDPYYPEFEKTPVKTNQLKMPPPHRIEIFVGKAYFVLSRDFIANVFSSDVVKDFLAWSEDTWAPEEHFWATLVRMPGVPGEVPRSLPDFVELRSKTRLVKWINQRGKLHPPCTGRYIREVCIYGAAEVHWLFCYGHWFANKFDPKVDPVAIQCMEETLHKRQKLFQLETSSTCRKAKILQ